jgi:hypothetical protein
MKISKNFQRSPEHNGQIYFASHNKKKIGVVQVEHCELVQVM